MSVSRDARRVEYRAVIFRSPGSYLIVRRRGPAGGAWDFPGAASVSHTALEQQLQNHCYEHLGCVVHVLAGRPPIPVSEDGRTTDFRFYLCMVLEDEILPLGYADVRWVSTGDLREYDYTRSAQLIVDQLQPTA